MREMPILTQRPSDPHIYPAPSRANLNTRNNKEDGEVLSHIFIDLFVYTYFKKRWHLKSESESEI